MGFIPDIPEDSPFTLNNIPFGVISTTDNPGTRCATAIGDYAVDLCLLSEQGFFKEKWTAEALAQSNLSAFAGLPRLDRTDARRAIINGLKSGSILKSCLIPLKEVTMHLPLPIRGFTDFFTSLEHCQNCSPMTNGNIAKNFFLTPSAYNGRATSVRPSPHQVRRPEGVFWNAENDQAIFGASRLLDFELEMGYIVAKEIPYGEKLAIDNAPEHIFGFVLLNDWSSRDIQRFEMAPLGPFNSKAFATTISPWVITLDALDPFACGSTHEHRPFDHLRFSDPNHSTFDIKLAARLIREGRTYPICTSNLKYLYWTPYQQITHQASSRSGLQTGDLIGTGTISGSGTDETGKKFELGCLFEAVQQPNRLEFGSGQGLFLKDGDELVLTGWCEDKNGKQVLGFGECKGKILPC